MKNGVRCLSFFLCCGVFAASASPGIKINPGNMSPYTKTHVGARLYTRPSEEAPGGIEGRIVDAPSKVLGVICMPQKFPNISSLKLVEGGSSRKNAGNVNTDMTNECYLATLTDDNRFQFHGLPYGKYDLFILCENCFYEGLKLNREEESLTEADKAAIKAKLIESNPFFNVKNQHRIEGQTGQFGRARVLEQEVRTLPVTDQAARVHRNIQIRSIKLCLLDSVGGARTGTHWDVKKTREIARQELGPPETKGVIPGFFRKDLQGIRVTGKVKDVGIISLDNRKEGR